MQCFIDDPIELFLPVLNDIGFIGRFLVRPQVRRNMVVDDSGKSTCLYSRCLIKFWTSAQENQSAVEKRRVAGFMNITQQRIAGAVDVVGN
jgi:hypothetical protein